MLFRSLATVYGCCLAKSLAERHLMCIPPVTEPKKNTRTELEKLAELGVEEELAVNSVATEDTRFEYRDCVKASGLKRERRDAEGEVPCQTPIHRQFVLHGGRVFAMDEGIGASQEKEVPVENERTETTAERKRREDELESEAKNADALWRKRADNKEWDHVKVDLEVYRYSGFKVKEDPRRNAEYRQKVADGLGFGEDAKEKHPELSAEEVAATREVLLRKAAAFWLEGTPRTTVRFVEHDTVPTGPPVKVPPHNLKGEAAEWIDAKLQEEVARGQLELGTSPWGSPPFPTREFAGHRKQRKRRIVVDYRRVNARTLRSVYFVRSAAGVVADAAGSIWMTLLDAVTGFNHIVNTDTERARKMLAILARSGQFLPRCLTFGPHNGPEDFCYVIDRFYSPGSRSKRRFCKEWLAYVDDLTVRTGRVLDGVFYTDEEHAARIKEASLREDQTAYQDAKEALEAQGFLAKDLGQEVAGPPGNELPEQGSRAGTANRKEKPVSLLRSAARASMLACGITNARALDLDQTSYKSSLTRGPGERMFRTPSRGLADTVRGHEFLPRPVCDSAIGMMRVLRDQMRIARCRLNRQSRLSRLIPSDQIGRAHV